MYPENEYALLLLDLDCFKTVNQERGYVFGNRVLKYLSEHLTKNIRKDDFAARVGGDEFLLFMRYNDKLEVAVKRICSSIAGELDGFPISVSMGIAKTSSVGRDYEDLYHCADLALFDAKQKGHGCYSFYDISMSSENIPTTISEIDHIFEI